MDSLGSSVLTGMIVGNVFRLVNVGILKEATEAAPAEVYPCVHVPLGTAYIIDGNCHSLHDASMYAF